MPGSAFSLSLFLLQAANDLLSSLADAAAAMPLALLLTLLLARKGHALLCQVQARLLAGLLCALTVLGPLALLCNFLLVTQQLTGAGVDWELPSFFAPAMLPYSSSCALWGLAALLSFLALHLIRIRDTSENKAPAPPPLLALCLLLFCSIFAARFCLSWPFAGLPSGLQPAEAAGVIALHTWHQTFFGLFSAALLSLLLFPLLRRRLCAQGCEESDGYLAHRAEALCGLVGGIPHLLNTFGTVSGYLLRSAPMPQRMLELFLQNIALLIVLVSLGLLVRKNNRHRSFLHRLALTFFFLYLLCPSICTLFVHFRVSG